MTYWNDVMHDDVALIMGDGWDGAARPRRTIENKVRKLSETPDLVVGTGRGGVKWKMDLIPPSLIVNRYFAKEKAELDALTGVAEASTQAVEEFVEENSGEEGLLADAMEDEKISKVLASTRLKVARYADPKSDEVKALTQLIALYDAETIAKRKAKEAQAKLDQMTLRQYAKLSTVDIQSLVIDDKWGTRMVAGLDTELGVLVQRLVERLNLLGQRYEKTVGDLDAEVEELGAKVAAHLAAMGVAG
jgi:type I restriction enzyme M protein